MLLLCALASLRLGVEVFADSSPFLIPFQGRLTNPQGVPYTNGQYTVIFNLYDQPVGGTVLWSETHQKIGVINGMVNMFLGSINTLTNVNFSQTRHLGITIDADGNPNTPDPEMVPRQMIIPAFWAKNAEKLNGYDWTPIFGVNSPVGSISGGKIQNQSITTGQIANNAVTANQIAAGAVVAAIANGTIQGQQIATGGLTVTNFSAGLIMDAIIPPGTIQAFGGISVPSGWLLCDGRALMSASYPRLYTAISTNWGAGLTNGVKIADFNLPDLRGRTVIGAGFGSNLTLRVLGRIGGEESHTLTIAEMPSHSHPLGPNPRVQLGNDNGVAYGIFQNGGDGTKIAPAGGDQPHNTMMPYAVINYIIKY